MALYMVPRSYYSGITKEDEEAMIAALRAQPPVNSLIVAKGPAAR